MLRGPTISNWLRIPNIEQIVQDRKRDKESI